MKRSKKELLESTSHTQSSKHTSSSRSADFVKVLIVPEMKCGSCRVLCPGRQ